MFGTYYFRPCFGRKHSYSSAVCSTAPSISSNSESDTRRAPGVSGATASLESPWRAVDQFTLTQSLSDIFQSMAFSSISCSFQYMLMPCSPSPLALPQEQTNFHVLSSAPQSGRECIHLSCRKKRKKKVLFSKSEKRSEAEMLTVIFFSISAPSGNLEWWMKSSVDDVTKRVNIHLLWKVHE